MKNEKGGMTFTIDAKKLERANMWMEIHYRTNHQPDELPKVPLKMIPGMPNYRYVFEDLNVCIAPSIVCDKCLEKAIRNSMGNMALFKKLCKRYDAILELETY